MAGGRPSKYTEETIPKTLEYMKKWESLGHKIPSIAGLAVHLKVRRDTIHEWRKEEGKEEFSDIIENLLALQELTLSGNGLSGDFNATISKLILTKHGYSDKVDQEIGGPGGGAVPVQYIINPVRPAGEEPAKDDQKE